jgi:hypothetical protein
VRATCRPGEGGRTRDRLELCPLTRDRLLLLLEEAGERSGLLALDLEPTALLFLAHALALVALLLFRESSRLDLGPLGIALGLALGFDPVLLGPFRGERVPLGLLGRLERVLLHLLGGLLGLVLGLARRLQLVFLLFLGGLQRVGGGQWQR